MASKRQLLGLSSLKSYQDLHLLSSPIFIVNLLQLLKCITTLTLELLPTRHPLPGTPSIQAEAYTDALRKQLSMARSLSEVLFCLFLIPIIGTLRFFLFSDSITPYSLFCNPHSNSWLSVFPPAQMIAWVRDYCLIYFHISRNYQSTVLPRK